MAGEAEARERVRAAVESTALVDGHAHNVVDLRSSFSFLHTFSEAQRQALRDVPHTLPFKVCWNPGDLSSTIRLYTDL